MNRYIGLKQVGKRLATPNARKFSETEIGEYRVVTVRKGARLDIIASNMYEDPSLWWVIAMVNGLITPFINMDINLIVPKNPNNIIQKVTRE